MKSPHSSRSMTAMSSFEGQGLHLWWFCWCSMLRRTDTVNLAARPTAKTKSLSAGCEIVSLTSSSFKAHVHLLRVVIVNQAISALCFFSSFPSAMCFNSACYCVSYQAPYGNVHACAFAKLKSQCRLTNYLNKYKTGNSAQLIYLTFLQFGLEPPVVSPKETDFTHIC